MPGIPKDLPSYDFVLGLVYGAKTTSAKPVKVINPLPIEHGDAPYLPLTEERRDQGPFQEQKALPTEAIPPVPPVLAPPGGLKITQ